MLNAFNLQPILSFFRSMYRDIINDPQATVDLSHSGNSSLLKRTREISCQVLLYYNSPGQIYIQNWITWAPERQYNKYDSSETRDEETSLWAPWQSLITPKHTDYLPSWELQHTAQYILHQMSLYHAWWLSHLHYSLSLLKSVYMMLQQKASPNIQ